MSDPNHYQTLQVNPQATQAEIKQSYRRLAKLYHPDSQHKEANHEHIVELNAAYEVLSDPHKRQSYDRQLRNPSATAAGDWQQRTRSAQKQYQKQRQNARDTDEQIELWLYQVYQPVNRLLCEILNPLEDRIEELSADPFDDRLLEAFQDYLKECRDFLEQAQRYFRSMPNPAQVAGVAASLYYCLDRVGDGINELEFFTFNYDESYLHAGHEMFRIAARLRREAQAALRSVAA